MADSPHTELPMQIHSDIEHLRDGLLDPTTRHEIATFAQERVKALVSHYEKLSKERDELKEQLESLQTNAVRRFQAIYGESDIEVARRLAYDGIAESGGQDWPLRQGRLVRLDVLDLGLALKALEGCLAEPLSDEVLDGLQAAAGVILVGSGEFNHDSDIDAEPGESGLGHDLTIPNTASFGKGSSPAKRSSDA